MGAAYGTAKAGTGISSISIWRPSVVMKSLIPVVMAGILGIYGMIVAVIISQKGTNTANSVKKDGSYNYRFGYSHMASGLVCGFSCVVNILHNKGCWLCHRNCWRCWYTSKCTTIETFCGSYIDIDLWLSFGFVWTDCIFDPCILSDFSYICHYILSQIIKIIT